MMRICTKVFSYDFILEVAEKRVCPIEHTSIFFLSVRCLAGITRGSRIAQSGQGGGKHGHFAGMPARTGGCVTSFNCSRSTSTLCQRTSSFFVSIGADRSE